MGGFAGALLLLVAGWVAFGYEGADVLGLTRRDASALLIFAAALLWLTGWAVERARPGLRATIGAIVMWLVFVATAVAVYVRRDAVFDGALALTDEIGLTRPEATVTGSGEVVVTRGFDGTFVVPARVNDRDTRFIFDTGASSVVLTHETAGLLGFKGGPSAFRIPITTANGRAFAAPVTIERLAVGPITFRRVPALVVARGVLHENLLGQSFLERLGSYEVRGRRLVLRAGNG